MLTPDQIDARKGKLTASRIACLMTGDAVKIMQLYQEMIGEAEEEDLSHIWAVQLGSATEQLSLDWYERKHGPVSRRGKVVVHPKYPWAAATLDGWCDLRGCPVEVKHVGGREPIEVVVDRYQPQMQWQMEVTGADQCAISIIMGAHEPVVEFIPRNFEYCFEMLKRGAQFMEHVRKHTPPVALDAVPPPVDASKVYDMTGSNEWAAHAAVWVNTVDEAFRCKESEKVLKALVPADAKKCHGYGIQITRNRAGSLSLREAQ